MKLTVELIPKTCAASNIRTLIPKKYWDKLRKKSYKEANFKCEICGDVGTNQGYRHLLECHEIWEYDVKLRTQRLKGLISLCPLCHQCKHIGRAKYIGKKAEVMKHLKKINKITKRTLDEYLDKEHTKYAEYSRIRWKLDLSLLEVLGINEKLIDVAHKTRITENKKPPKSYYKKKYKTKSKKKTTKKKIKKRPKRK